MNTPDLTECERWAGVADHAEDAWRATFELHDMDDKHPAVLEERRRYENALEQLLECRARSRRDLAAKIAMASRLVVDGRPDDATALLGSALTDVLLNEWAGLAPASLEEVVSA